jgi:hypothetical protein
METKAIKANEILADMSAFKPPEELFDAYWRAGELAMLTGPAGAGKSLLAVQMAEALARGSGIETFRMPEGRRKVLYVDMVHSRAQFQQRYSHVAGGRGGKPRIYRFSENFYRAEPDDLAGFEAWLRAQIEEHRFQAVVIDDLAAFKETLGGTREMLRLMRGLRKIKRETGISILVLWATRPRAAMRPAGDDGSAARHMLAEIADSVFALDMRARQNEERCLVQVHSRGARIVWDSRNAPVCRIVDMDDGFTRLAFDRRSTPPMDTATAGLVCRIKAMHDAGTPYRQIAKELGLAFSKVVRLCRKWTIELEETVRQDTGEGVEQDDAAACGPPDEPEEWEEAGYERPVWMDEEDLRRRYLAERMRAGEITEERCEPAEEARLDTPHGAKMDPSKIPFAAGLRRRCVYDLKLIHDKYGAAYYIEEEEPKTGRPMVWYTVDGARNLQRFVRGTWGTVSSYLGKTIYLPPERALMLSIPARPRAG